MLSPGLYCIEYRGVWMWWARVYDCVVVVVNDDGERARRTVSMLERERVVGGGCLFSVSRPRTAEH
jgi:hypothetical protein